MTERSEVPSGPRGPRRPGASRPAPASDKQARQGAKAPAKQRTKTSSGPAAKAPASKPAGSRPPGSGAPSGRSGPPAKRRRIPDAPGPRPEPRPERRGSRPTGRTAPVRIKDDRPATSGGRPAAKRSGPAPQAKPKAKPKTRPAAKLPAPESPKSPFRQRYGVVHNTQGPRVRLGVLWALAVIGALAIEPLRPYGFATIYGVVAGAAALQVVDAWIDVRSGGDRWVAALGASTLPVVATLGVRALGAALLVLVAAALITAAVAQERETSLVAAAGHTVLAAGVCGGAAASLVLLADYEIGAVIILLIFLMVYDASDYVVGSGAANGFEGPVAGALAIAAVASFVAVAEFPPFRGADIWSFAMLAAVACPAGQILASAMLPRADAEAPALRRLDSALVAGPAWAGLIGLYLQHAGG